MELRKEENWVKEIKKRLIDLALTVKKLALLIGISFTTISPTLNDKYNHLNVAEKVNAKVLELEAKRGNAYVPR